MKTQIFALVVTVTLSGCSVGQEKSVQESFTESLSSSIEEPTEEELAEQLVEEAERAVFSELNVKNPSVDKKVTASGKVVAVLEEGIMGTFVLESVDGVYTIMNLTKTEVVEKSNITIYGTVAVDKAADGTPVINALVIE